MTQTQHIDPEPYHKNPRQITDKQFAALERDLAELGDLSGIVHNVRSNQIVGGNQRSRVFNISEAQIEIVETLDEPDEQGTIAHGFVVWNGNKFAYRRVDWDERREEKANIVANKAGGTWDFDILANAFDMDDLLEWGFEEFELIGSGEGDSAAEANDAEAQVSRAEELRELWGVEVGQVWRLPARDGTGEHRLICGDCTDSAVVDRVMGGDKAAVVHADPPYGMGKEKDGIANDNLYRDKLDKFQMRWWKASRPFVGDNGSAYIWGNAEDLWRLWYVGGLSNSERLTFRNEIVWSKGDAGAGGISHQGADGLRLYPNSTERCIFFMLGEQGFNNNADNYWEGWEPIRAALKSDCDKMGWGPNDIKRITGVGMYSHWFTRSQWTMIPAEHYAKLQAAAREHGAFGRDHEVLSRDYDAFKRDYDDLKQAFYATRAHFDNTHENMTDVWGYSRVSGDDRHGHATPKPAEMVMRAIKSSCPTGEIVYAPFSGTSPEIVAAENTGRYARAVEIDAGYVAVSLQRYQDTFGITPELTQ